MIDFILKISIIIVNYKCWLSSAYKLKKEKEQCLHKYLYTLRAYITVMVTKYVEVSKLASLISMLMWCTHLFVDFEIIYSHVSLVQKGFNTEKVLKYCQYVDV